MKPSTSTLLLGAVLAAGTLGACKDRTTETRTTTTETVPAPAPVPAPEPAPPAPDSTTPATGTSTTPATTPPPGGTSGTSGTRGATGSGTDAYGNPVHADPRNDHPDHLPDRDTPRR